MKDFKLKDVLISVLIVSVTLLYFQLNNFVPDGLESINILGFEIGSFGFPDINHLVYYSKMKFLILFFSITWYLTSKHWWRSAILVIITIELLKLITALNSNNRNFDEIDYVVSLPITIPIILILILVSRKINNYSLAKELRLTIDNEVDEVFFELHSIDKTQLDILNKTFKEIKKEKKVNTYLKKLILIRDKFYIN